MPRSTARSYNGAMLLLHRSKEMTERNVRRFRWIETAQNRRTYSPASSASFLTQYGTHGLLKHRSKPKPAALMAFELVKIVKAGNPGHKLGPVISSTLFLFAPINWSSD
jgi:hypothetical protein